MVTCVCVCVHAHMHTLKVRAKWGGGDFSVARFCSKVPVTVYGFFFFSPFSHLVSHHHMAFYYLENSLELLSCVFFAVWVKHHRGCSDNIKLKFVPKMLRSLIFSCSHYLFVPMWIFLEFGKKWWLAFVYFRGLEEHRSSTFGTWWLLTQAHSSQGQTLILFPTNAPFWNRANEVHWIGSEVRGRKLLSREVFKFWRTDLEFVEQLNIQEIGPVNLFTRPASAEVKWQQVNRANSRHSRICGIIKQTQNFKLCSVQCTKFMYQNLKPWFLLTM